MSSLVLHDVPYEDLPKEWAEKLPSGQHFMISITPNSDICEAANQKSPYETMSEEERMAVLDSLQGCINTGLTMDQIDGKIAKMRTEWDREWES